MGSFGQPKQQNPSKQKEEEKKAAPQVNFSASSNLVLSGQSKVSTGSLGSNFKAGPATTLPDSIPIGLNKFLEKHKAATEEE
jgi:hypothetical protein